MVRKTEKQRGTGGWWEGRFPGEFTPLLLILNGKIKIPHRSLLQQEEKEQLICLANFGHYIYFILHGERKIYCPKVYEVHN